MNTSYRIVELVRAKISNQHLTASDTDVSRVLGLSRAQVSAYKHSKSVMSPETLQLANKLLQLDSDDFDEILLALTIEGTREPELRSAWRRISRSAAPVALAMVATGMFLAFPENQDVFTAFLVAPFMHYAPYGAAARGYAELPPPGSDRSKPAGVWWLA